MNEEKDKDTRYMNVIYNDSSLIIYATDCLMLYTKLCWYCIVHTKTLFGFVSLTHTKESR